ncbi:hypothetical protein ACE1CI_27885 [Aerosakkonemataceae cyanobacterium BLCC-F50]|uniref:Uncharacterized protein n=1 Tax=Floridaenema flaviceps BLCC-F50 TaxID=3153642 RepID=A0ABV4XZ15_9CYAN
MTRTIHLLTTSIPFGNLKVSSLPQLLMGSQSTAKTIFLLASMVGWLIVGASLMYLFPAIADWLISSERTHLWMHTLSRSGYNPLLAWAGGGITLVITVSGYIIWHLRFEGKI